MILCHTVVEVGNSSVPPSTTVVHSRNLQHSSTASLVGKAKLKDSDKKS